MAKSKRESCLSLACEMVRAINVAWNSSQSSLSCWKFLFLKEAYIDLRIEKVALTLDVSPRTLGHFESGELEFFLGKLWVFAQKMLWASDLFLCSQDSRFEDYLLNLADVTERVQMFLEIDTP